MPQHLPLLDGILRPGIFAQMSPRSGSKGPLPGWDGGPDMHKLTQIASLPVDFFFN